MRAIFRTRSMRVFSLLLWLFVPGLQSVFAQGTLTPPSPPAPTMKTLDQIEARIPISVATTPGDSSDNFVITKPGSYYLTTNFVNSAGKGGIRIDTNNVTIDLNGFAMDGSGLGGQGIRIITSIQRRNIKVRNGVVCNWNSTGLGLSFAVNAIVENILVSGNQGEGIEMGENGLVKDCQAYTNATGASFLAGIVAAQGSVVENCVAEYNGNGNANCFGISVGSGSTISHCAAFQNNGPSATGIITGSHCQLIDCVASFSTGTNGYGISLGPGSSAVHCVASQNSGPGTIGILAAQHSTVDGCVASFNGGDGIQAPDNCSLTANKCDNNAAAGIHTTGQRNRIDGNFLAFNVTAGIKVDSNLNLVVRNCATGTGIQNYVIAAGNSDAERMAGSTGFTSTDPWANFSF
jgi:hypothetical protein